MRRLALAAIGLLPSVMYSQSAPNEADTLTHILNDVEITAKASKSATSAAPVHIINRADIARTGVTDVSDALHRMPGVVLRDYGGAGGLKTVSVRGFGAGHTGVFYDGVPLSDVQSGQIDLSRYSIDNVSSVAMVIGDNEDIFIPARHAASAATVSISSLPVICDRELSAKIRVGSYGFVNPFVRIGLPVGKSAAVNFIGQYTHADNNYPFKLVNGDYTTTERRNNSSMNSVHAETNMLCEIGNHTTLSSKIYWYDNSRRLPGPVILYNNVNHERLLEQNAIAQAQIRSSIVSGLSIKGIVKYNFASSLYHDEDSKYPGGMLDQNYWQREYYASAALLFAPADKWLFDYSADYFYNSLNSNLPSNKSPRRNSILQSATAKYKSGSLTFMARLLYSRYINRAKIGVAAKNASKLSPSLSLSWKPLDEHLLFVRASYKNIFRMPTFNEAYFDHYGSTDILPESTNQINAGATYTFGPAGNMSMLTLSLDGYVNNIKDMIVGVPYNMFVWKMMNLGKVRSAGIDATCELAVAPAARHAITLSGSYSYQRAMPRTDRSSSEWMKQVAYIPRHSGSASISYENPLVNISLQGTGVSARYTTNNNQPETRIAGYVELGASAWRSFSIGGCRAELRADVQNLLDKQYCVVARYPMPGRLYKFTISFEL